jgi:hypothetical protein
LSAGIAGIAAPGIRSTIEGALDEYRATFEEPLWQTYLRVHHRRYRILVELAVLHIDAAITRTDDEVRVLVVGPRFEVDLLHRLRPTVPLDTLGINAGLFPAREGERNIEFDLNEADRSTVSTVGNGYAVVIMAEVMEHLHTAPSIVLPWLRQMMQAGGVLIIQTPNAVALPNRLRMLLGMNPFQPLSTDRAYPGHIREYTAAELRREAVAAGFDVVELRALNYFMSTKPSNNLYQRLERLMPSTWRGGISMVLRKPVSLGHAA